MFVRKLYNPDVEPGGDATPAVDPNAVVSFKAAGAQREMTVQEALQWASKAIGADARMQEAAAKEKELTSKLQAAEEAAAWKADFEAAQTGDPDGIRRFGKRQGWTDEQIEAIVARHTTTDDGESADSVPARSPVSPKYLKLLDRMDKFFQAADSEGLDPLAVLRDSSTLVDLTGEANAKNVLKEQLTKDPVFGRMLRSSKGDAIFNDVFSRVKRRVASRQPFEAAIQDAMNESRGILDAVSEVVAPKTPDGVHPGSFGMLPNGAGGRLQPPKRPKLEEFKGNPVDYLPEALMYAEWEAQNSG